jgi:hypothetical protein
LEKRKVNSGLNPIHQSDLSFILSPNNLKSWVQFLFSLVWFGLVWFGASSSKLAASAKFLPFFFHSLFSVLHFFLPCFYNPPRYTPEIKKLNTYGVRLHVGTCLIKMRVNRSTILWFKSRRGNSRRRKKRLRP